MSIHTSIHLQNSRELQQLLKRVEELNQWNNLFAQHIEPSLAKHCYVTNIKDDCLIVIVENGSWASKLRFQIPELLSLLRKYPQWQHLKGICYKTRPQKDLIRTQSFRSRALLKPSQSALDALKKLKKIVNSES